MFRLVHCSLLVLIFASPLVVQIGQPGNPTLIEPAATSTPTPLAGSPAISTPQAGAVLQGAISVSGSCGGPEFVAAELSFSYADDPTGTWFWIATQNQPVSDQLLTTWDTSSITDGNYDLRLQVYFTDGSTPSVIVKGLRVRNYTPIETPTPTPMLPQATPLPTITSTSTPFPTPTNLPRNQAVLSPREVTSSVIYGGLSVCLLFILMGLYLWLRRNM